MARSRQAKQVCSLFVMKAFINLSLESDNNHSSDVSLFFFFPVNIFDDSENKNPA